MTLTQLPKYLLHDHRLLALYCFLQMGRNSQPSKIRLNGVVVEVKENESVVSNEDIIAATGIQSEIIPDLMTSLDEVELLKIAEISSGYYKVRSQQNESIPVSETFEEFSKKYIEYVSSNMAPKTLDNAKRVIKAFCIYAGSKSIAGFTAEDIEEFKRKRKDEVGLTTINMDIRTIRAAFNVAISWKRIKENPCDSVKQLKINDEKTKFFAREQCDLLLANIKDAWFRRIVLFAIVTGLRRGEIPNLKWTDYDQEKQTISIQSSSEYRVKGGKARTIVLHEDAIKILQLIPRKGELIFVRDQGEPVDASHISKKLKKLIRKLGLPEDLHFHSLRHTFGTYAADAGVPVNTIKEIMGHSSILTTQNYIGVNREVMKNELKKISMPC